MRRRYAKTMKAMKKKHILIWSFVAVLLLLDQALKIYIKTHFTLGESVHLFDWFQIIFIENPGMAFGMSFGPKIALTLFRIVLSAFIVWYIVKLVRDNYRWGYLFCVALILAGAIGNIIDCMFYGICFGESTYTQVAEFLPAAGGYAPFMQGKVVDMFYFPLFTFPNWVPLLGGEIFFSPVFNIADSAITVGIIVLILFFSKDFNTSFDRYFSRKKSKSATEEPEK